MVKGLMGVVGGQDRLVTSPSLCSLGVDWNLPQQRWKRMSSSQARGRSASWGGDGGEVKPIICKAESESSTTSTLLLEGHIPIYQHGC
jgi:hypothetical protein